MMRKVWMSLALFAGVFVMLGCGQKSPETVSVDKKAKPAAKAEKVEREHGDHGWWCDEHGVKEEECSMCQKDILKKLKPDEICPKHPDRAKAQCFICNPELWEKSKAIYVAKYGKEPPVPDDNKPAENKPAENKPAKK